jgi:hypothetical protein
MRSEPLACACGASLPRTAQPQCPDASERHETLVWKDLPFPPDSCFERGWRWTDGRGRSLKSTYHQWSGDCLACGDHEEKKTLRDPLQEWRRICAESSFQQSAVVLSASTPFYLRYYHYRNQKIDKQHNVSTDLKCLIDTIQA